MNDDPSVPQNGGAIVSDDEMKRKPLHRTRREKRYNDTGQMTHDEIFHEPAHLDETNPIFVQNFFQNQFTVPFSFGRKNTNTTTPKPTTTTTTTTETVPGEWTKERREKHSDFMKEYWRQRRMNRTTPRGGQFHTTTISQS
uniref:Uncharacterized protein n=2 Tax=Cacopsylla melanoneura TaxID=428564 RepID=A0A8D8S691_9HEMI